MPWVRLHAIKSYLDMPWAIEHAHPEATATFNLVPCLTEQLLGYVAGSETVPTTPTATCVWTRWCHWTTPSSLGFAWWCT